MSRASRIAGAILAETKGRHYLVGNIKEPCDWEVYGFEDPGEIVASDRSFIELKPLREISPVGVQLSLNLEGAALAELLFQRLVIHRNGSVSERLWNLVSGSDGTTPQESLRIDARWLGEIPAPLWAIVRDAVLRC